MRRPDDDVLLERIRNDDEKGLDQLFLNYYPGLISYARFHLPYPSDESEDIVQEVFLKIWQQRHSLAIQSSFAAYLYTTVRNRIRDYHRSNGRQASLPIDELTDAAEAPAQTIPDRPILLKELNTEISRLIDQLPPATRMVFLMNRSDNLTYTEIAAFLHVSVNTVKTLMYRALKFLKENYRSFSFIF
ncbi:MAG: RNA polymerase sigma-70 factor [Chitinophagaceae bacterium]